LLYIVLESSIGFLFSTLQTHRNIFIDDVILNCHFCHLFGQGPTQCNHFVERRNKTNRDLRGIKARDMTDTYVNDAMSLFSSSQ
jgi:hypothetical protein